LNGSWQEVYEQAIRKHPAIRYIYDAIDLLRQIEFSPFRFLVKRTALLLWDGNSFQKLIRQAQIGLALEYLTTETRIMRQVDSVLSPSDGQIEAKSTKTDWHDHTLLIKQLIFEKTSDDLSQLLADLLFLFGMRCLESGNSEDALKTWRIIPFDNLSVFFNGITSLPSNNRIPGFRNTMSYVLKQEPNSYYLHFFLGIMLEGLERYTEAEDVYRQCLTQNPDDAYVHTKLGDVLRYLKRYGEAEEEYRRAIEKNPNYADAYSRLGSLYRKLKRFTDAEIGYRKAITLDPNNFNAAFIYLRHGEMLRELQRYEEAEDAFRQAIFRDPNYADAYFGQGVLFQRTGRTKEAVQLLKMAIESEPERDKTQIYLRIASLSKQIGEEIPSLYLENVRKNLNEDDWYNLACLESICGNFAVAFEHLSKAVKHDEFNPRWAWEDPDFQWIRDDPRFVEIVGPKPEAKSLEV
jgi:tetratricopeptide (TPR) repeat protein